MNESSGADQTARSGSGPETRPAAGPEIGRIADRIRHLGRSSWISLLLLGVATSTQAAVFYVGTGPGCDTTTLDGAVIGAAFTLDEDDEIRLTSNLDDVSRELRNFDPAGIGAITIRGGYADCLGTRNDTGSSALLGFGNDPVLEIVADGASSDVTLRDLRILRLGGTARGITVTGGDARLHLVNTRVEFNDGGGLSMSGPVLVDADEDSSISDNDAMADPGGGIFCTAGGRIELAGAVLRNSTTSLGGGVFLEDGCELVLEGRAGLLDNVAGFGGAVAASVGATVRSASAASSGALIFRNAATSDGGGIFLGSAEATLENAVLQQNMAGNRGGALFVDSESDLIFFGSGSCEFACAALYSNELVDPGGAGLRPGAAIYVAGGSSAALFRTAIRGQLEANDRGRPVFATGAGTTLHLESVLLAGNRAESLIDVRSGASAVAAFVTAADNAFLLGGQSFPPAGAVVSDGSSLEIYSSILGDHGDFAVDASSTAFLDCVLADTFQGVFDVQRAALVDPQLDADGRPLPGSPAIDYCDTPLYVPVVADLLGTSRGLDVASAPDFLGRYDLGAYEVPEPEPGGATAAALAAVSALRFWRARG